MHYDFLKLEITDKQILWPTGSCALSEVNHLYFSADLTTYNMMLTNRYVAFFLSYTNTDEEKIVEIYSEFSLPNAAYILMKRPFGGLSKKQFENLVSVYFEIAECTVQHRYNYYINELNTTGAFRYNGYSFLTNGDIKKKDRVILNLYNEMKNNNVYYGAVTRGPHSKSDNPNLLTINNNAVNISLFGKSFGDKLSLETCLDRDVFYMLLRRLDETGSFI